jgi:hypothetical protein
LGAQRRQRRGRQGRRQRAGRDACRVLSGVTTVQRINTSGGKLEGSCDKAGSFKSAPYSADYVFLRKT